MAIGNEPRQHVLHTSLGHVYLHAGKWPEAEAEFHQELQLDSRNELAWLGLANVQVVNGEATAALESRGEVWGISPEFLTFQQEFPSIELAQQAKAAISSRRQEPEEAAKHFLLATIYVTTKESALS